MNRKFIQFFSFLLLNSYFKGFTNKVNYGGTLKGVCVPVLNCWSCPSALTSCPIGAMEIYIKSRNFPFLPLVFIIVPGLFFGRFFCGFLCPAGLLQELLFKIKTKKYKLNNKFVFFPLLSLVFGVILFSYLFSSAWFSRFICPMGLIQASIPWILLEPSLIDSLGYVFVFKVIFLIFLIFMNIFIYRFFCRTLCPLGFMLGFFNKFALLKITYFPENCNKCEKCADICPVDLKIPEEVNSFRCVRCMNCVNICQNGCLKV